MSVSISWSYTNGGTAISSIVDHGNVANGNATSIKEIHVRHNGAFAITNAGLYIRQYSGTYTGSFTPGADIAEILGWGDQVASSDFGGFMVNFNALTLGPTYTSGWPTYDNKSPSGAYVLRTGIGDSELNAITLPVSTGVSVVGEVPAGSSPNVRFGIKCAVPASESTIGIRQWEQVLVYTATS